MKRRSRNSLSGLILLLALSLCGCGEKEKEPVTITVIHAWGGTGADHVAMRDIYDGFQKENPDIEVQMISMPAREEMLRKVEDMIMVGNMPDVITFSGMGQNTTYDFIVKNNMALDIMPYLKEDKEFAANISRTNLNYWTTDNGQLFKGHQLHAGITHCASPPQIKNFRCRDRRRGLHTAMISSMIPSSTPAARG